jgi:hypothetical protein
MAEILFFRYGCDRTQSSNVNSPILQLVTGDDQSLDRDTARVRGSLKYPAESRQFRSSHLPAIANAYDHVWESDDVVISDRTLNEIEHQIRDLIRHSNKAPMVQVIISDAVFPELSMMKNKDRPADEEDDDDAQPSLPKRMRKGGPPLLVLSPTQAIPSCFKLVELKKTRVNELAAIEHCLWLRQHRGLPLSQVALEELAESLGLSVEQLIPTTISLLELNELVPMQLTMARLNVKMARHSMLEKRDDLFLPNDDDLLVRWKSDGARY